MIDSYAWVEIFEGTTLGRAARDRIDEADDVFTPDVVLAEVARKYIRQGARSDVVRKRLQAILMASQAVGIDVAVAEESAEAWLELDSRARRKKLGRPSLVDGIVLATSRINNAKVLSGDKHFEGLPETIWLGAERNRNPDQF